MLTPDEKDALIAQQQEEIDLLKALDVEIADLSEGLGSAAPDEFPDILLLKACRVLLAQQQEEIATLHEEVSKYLSPENENVRTGDTLASIRDMAQILVTSKDNAREALAQLATLRQHRADILEEYRDELTKEACDRCEDCGELTMCRFHSVLSLLSRDTLTNAEMQRLAARLQGRGSP